MEEMKGRHGAVELPTDRKKTEMISRAGKDIFPDKPEKQVEMLRGIGLILQALEVTSNGGALNYTFFRFRKLVYYLMNLLLRQAHRFADLLLSPA